MARKPAAVITILCYFLPDAAGGGGREGGGVSASQQPLLCRIHAVKLWLFRREKQKATAPVLNIVSFLPVSFSFYLSLSPPRPPPLPLLYTHTLSVLLADKRLAVRGEGGEHPGCRPQQQGAHRFSTLKRRNVSPKCRDFSWEKGEAAWESIREEWVDISKNIFVRAKKGFTHQLS